MSKFKQKMRGKWWIIPLSLLAASWLNETYAVTLPTVHPALVSGNNQSQVSGVIRDLDSGKPIPGVTVSVKGTDQIVQTDGNGRYTVRANMGQVLVVSSIGYRTLEQTIFVSL